MKTPVTTSPRLDAIDTERFEEMLTTDSFRLFGARIAAELERARTDCETQTGLTAKRAQGRVSAFRTVLDLPAMILAEMKAPKK